jgi:hypothetical protein
VSERVELRHHTDAGADLRAVRGRVEPEEAQRARMTPATRSDHPHRAALAGAVGAEEAEHLAGLHLHVDAADGGEVSEALDELLGDDEWFRHGGATVPGERLDDSASSGR